MRTLEDSVCDWCDEIHDFNGKKVLFSKYAKEVLLDIPVFYTPCFVIFRYPLAFTSLVLFGNVT